MADDQEDPRLQIEAARKAFEQEFERFAGLAENSAALAGLDLEAAETEQRALADLRTRHQGTKSALAAGKKMTGRVAAPERAAFGQFVQQTDAEMNARLTQAEQALSSFI